MKAFLEYVNLSGIWSNTQMDDILNMNLSGLNFPTPTIHLPTKMVFAKINKIHYNSNPITILLSDGTEWTMNKEQWDYLKSIGRKPKEGKTCQMEVLLDGTVKNIVIS